MRNTSGQGSPAGASKYASKAGKNARGKTLRYEASHLAEMMCQDGNGVVSNTSRLPRSRSSTSDVTDVTLNIKRPMATSAALTRQGNSRSASDSANQGNDWCFVNAAFVVSSAASNT